MIKKIESRFINADQVAAILGVSKSTAYKKIREMNDELKDQGKITVAGKISKRYFEEKTYM